VVYPLVGEVVRRTGAYLIPRAFKAFNRYDVAFHKGLFGKAGGRGWRHGRDAGLAVSSQIEQFRKGDIDSAVPYEPWKSGKASNKFQQARNRRANKRRNRCNNYNTSRRRRR